MLKKSSVSQYCIAFRIMLQESKKNDLFFRCFLLNKNVRIIIQGLHRLEKYLNLEGFLKSP